MSTFYFRTNVHCLTGAFVGLLTLLSFVNALCSQELDQVSAHIDAETSALIRIDSAAFDALIDNAKQDDQDAEQTVLQARLKKTREILGNDSIWLTIGFPQSPLSVQILVRDPDGKRIETLKELWDFSDRPSYGPVPRVVIRKLMDSKPQASDDALRLAEWKKLMVLPEDAQGERGMIQFACLPPANLYETYRELLTDLPDSLGGGSVTLLTDGLQSISGTIDLTTGAVEATIGSASPAAATAFADRSTRLLASLSRNKKGNAIPKLVRPLIPLLQSSTFKPVDSQVRWQIAASEDWRPAEMLKLAVGSESSRSAMMRLRNLALGVLNYESARQHLPPPAASRGPDGPTGLSWRVHILPYLGKDEGKLYKQFKLDEPWDSPTNIKLLRQMPNIYSKYGSKLFAPADAKPGYTTVVAPSSENTILGAPRRVTFSAISDGSSNTILMMMVKDSLAVPWTAPQDYVFDRDQPASGLQFTDGRVPAAMCDGSAMLLSEAIENEDWIGLFEMNDGLVVTPK